MPIKMPMIAITTKSSTSVKAVRLAAGLIVLFFPKQSYHLFKKLTIGEWTTIETLKLSRKVG